MKLNKALTNTPGKKGIYNLLLAILVCYTLTALFVIMAPIGPARPLVTLFSVLVIGARVLAGWYTLYLLTCMRDGNCPNGVYILTVLSAIRLVFELLFHALPMLGVSMFSSALTTTAVTTL